jgi:hypothetical protein
MNRLCTLLGLLLALAAAAAEPLPLFYFRLGDGGQDRNAALPAELQTPLKVREGLAVTPQPPGRLAWSDLSAAGPRLVIAEVHLGQRFTLVALRTAADGSVQTALARPGNPGIRLRRDGGQPGPDQLLDNAYVELVADVAAALARPLPDVGEAVGFRVVPWPEGGSGMGLSVPLKQAGEALGLLALRHHGQVARLQPADGALTLALRQRAIMVDTEWRRGERAVRRLEIRQTELGPYLRLGASQLRPWGQNVADVRLVQPDWGPVQLLHVAESQLYLVTGKDEFQQLDGLTGKVTTLKAPPPVPGVAAAGSQLVCHAVGQPKPVWQRDLGAPVGGGLATIGDQVYAFTDDGALHVLQAADGQVVRRVETVRRIRGAAAALIGNRLWVSDFGGALLALDPATGSLASETPLADVLLLPVQPWGDGLLAVTRVGKGYRLSAAGAIVAEHALGGRLVAGVVCGDAAKPQVVAGDERGILWLLTPDAEQPRLLANLGAPLVPPLLIAGPLLARWPATGGDDDTLELDEDRGTFLLANTADGFLVQLRYPFPPAAP